MKCWIGKATSGQRDQPQGRETVDEFVNLKLTGAASVALNRCIVLGLPQYFDYLITFYLKCVTPKVKIHKLKCKFVFHCSQIK